MASNTVPEAYKNDIGAEQDNDAAPAQNKRVPSTDAHESRPTSPQADAPFLNHRVGMMDDAPIDSNPKGEVDGGRTVISSNSLGKSRLM
jgi:hypothetical protein